ncbi:MAG: DUF1801 domain-containing protein [Bacteroidales bacterium]|nr:DUF1801 domain-containing protein [Bacteroidales bacterium]MCB8998712.1 DUF1801 domain-containing protein [Bacteroidales bacterium]
MKSDPVASVDDYMDKFEGRTRILLEELRRLILSAVPEAEEKIGYQMPSYKLHGILFYFAGYKNHIGFYPGPAAIMAFKSRIGIYKWSKGTLQFPLDEDLPTELIMDIILFKKDENLRKAEQKKRKASGI